MSKAGTIVWTTLERYFELRESYPITSILHAGNSGRSDSTTPGLPRNHAFLADLGMCLAALNPQEREAIDAYFEVYCAMTRADCLSREASLEIFRALKGADKQAAIKRRKEWTREHEEHQKRLDIIRKNPHYRSAMNRLEISIPLVRHLGGYVSREEQYAQISS